MLFTVSPTHEPNHNSEDGYEEEQEDVENEEQQQSVAAANEFDEEEQKEMEGRFERQELERRTRTPAREARVSRRPTSGGGAPSGGSSSSVRF